MKDEPLVSVIIPTYNRGHLIGETLDSVLAQTYQNWECIIVDDGSSDNTDKVVSEYVTKDSRFKYFHRPDEHLPGGNGARNYGFKMSQGKYIQWFDSDDLMVAEKLELKVKAMLENDVDFVVSKTANFKPNNKNTFKINKYDNNLDYKLNLINFLNKKSYCLTYDFFTKKRTVRDVKFSESIKSNQETNFFIKFLSQREFKSHFIDRVLTKRRLHDNTIRSRVETDIKTSSIKKSLAFINAYEYLTEKNINKPTLVKIESIILRSLLWANFELSKNDLETFACNLKRNRGIFQFICFNFLIFFKRYKKGYIFYKKLQNYDKYNFKLDEVRHL